MNFSPPLLMILPPFFLQTLSLFSWLLKHHSWDSYFSGHSFQYSVAGFLFSTCFSQCWHFPRISPRLFLPSVHILIIAHLHSWLPLLSLPQ